MTEGGDFVKVVVQKNRRGKWFWKLVAGNGRVLAHSEDYSSRRACLKTADKVKGGMA